MTTPDAMAALRADPEGRALLDAVAAERGVHLVGGAVRDLLRGARPRDLDVVVEGDAIALAGRLAERMGGEFIGHDRFGTASVRVGERRLDLAAARSERYPRPGALPEVRAAPLREDLERRDFTVHAIALTLGAPEAGRLTAVDLALEDLAAARMRVLHELSFVDDPTRVLRLARYASRLGFSVEPGTHVLARAAVDGGALDTVSGPRVGGELRLVLHEGDPIAALEALAELGVDRAIDPALGVERAFAEQALALLPSAPDADADSGRAGLVLACFVRSVGARAPELLTRLGFSSAEARVALALAGGELDALASALDGTPGTAAILEALGRRSVEEAALVGALGAEPAARRWIEDLRHLALAIDGGDLVAAGVAEGPAVGRGLRAALVAKAEGVARSPGEELAVALAAAAGGA